MGRMPIEEKLDRQLKFHRVEWRVQRVGWIVLTTFLLLAFAGLFGGGPLSHAHVEGSTGRIDYERFVRYGSSSEFVVTPASGAAHGLNRIEITSDYLEAFRIERITPEPTTVRMSGRQLVYEFTAAGAGASVSFHMDPHRLWQHRTLVRIDGGMPLEIRQLTYP